MRQKSFFKRLNEILILTLLGCFLQSCTTLEKSNEEVDKKSAETILDHKYFVVSYDKNHKVPKYVKYTATKNEMAGSAKRRDRFFADPQLQQVGILGVGKDDMQGSGYDRGHMAPAADFKRSQEAMDETFVMSNMVPQSPGLNQKAWSKLEKRVRGWVCGEEKITIITGPVLREGLPRLQSGISIPEKFFKILNDETPPLKSICFIYLQEDTKDVYRERAMSVEKCEEIAKLSFPDVANKQKYDLGSWKTAKCPL